MYKNLSILIVEDEVLLAQDTYEMLQEVEIKDVRIALNYEEAINQLKQFDFDLILIDIMLGDSKNGLDLAEYITQNKNTSFIFLSSVSELNMLKIAIKTSPIAYLSKPFSMEQLLTHINFAFLNKINNEYPENQLEEKNKNHLIIKEGRRTIKINYELIYSLKSDKNYIEISTKYKKHRFRGTIGQTLKNLPQEIFIRCSKNTIVNRNHIKIISSDTIEINSELIPTIRNFNEILKKSKNNNSLK